MKRIFWGIIFSTVAFGSSCDKSKSTDPDPDPVDKQDNTPVVVSTLKVMAYNIHHCNPPAKANVIDVNAIVNAINGEKPDIIALQEVDVNTQRSGNMNQAQEIAAKLNMPHYFFGKAIDYQGGEYGVAIISKYPLTEKVVHRLPTKAGSGGEARVLATAKATLPDGTAVRFGSTHLDAQSDPANRELQIAEIQKIATTELLPFVVAGDFNAVPGSEVINALDQIFRRTCQTCPPTIPATNPTRVIDFIAYKHPQNKFSVASHKVVNEQYASDHRPIVTVINIQK